MCRILVCDHGEANSSTRSQKFHDPFIRLIKIVQPPWHIAVHKKWVLFKGKEDPWGLLVLQKQSKSLQLQPFLNPCKLYGPAGWSKNQKIIDHPHVIVGMEERVYKFCSAGDIMSAEFVYWDMPDIQIHVVYSLCPGI